MKVLHEGQFFFIIFLGDFGQSEFQAFSGIKNCSSQFGEIYFLGECEEILELINCGFFFLVFV